MMDETIQARMLPAVLQDSLVELPAMKADAREPVGPAALTAGAFTWAWPALIVALSLFNLLPWIEGDIYLHTGILWGLGRLPWEGWMLGVWAAQATLLTIWIVLGTGRWRWLAAGLALVALATTAVVGEIPRGLFRVPFGWAGVSLWDFLEVAQYVAAFVACLMVSVGGTLFYFRYVRGWRLVGKAFAGELPRGRPIRFSLRHLFIGMAAVAGCMVLNNKYQFMLLPAVALNIGQVAALVLIACMSLALRARLFAEQKLLDLFILLAFGVGVLVFVALQQPQIAFVALTWFLFVLAGFVWLRLCGWRLGTPKAKAR